MADDLSIASITADQNPIDKGTSAPAAPVRLSAVK